MYHVVLTSGHSLEKKMYLYKLQFLTRETRSPLTKNNNYLPYVFLNT